MRKKTKEFLALVGGVCLIILGILGLFLPFLQGILFLVFGFYLLMRYSPRFRRFTKHFRGHHPRIDGFFDLLDTKVDKHIQKEIAKDVEKIIEGGK